MKVLVLLLLLTIILSVVAMNLSCENLGLMQNREKTDTQVFPTAAPTEKVVNKEDFEKHYSEGLRIEFNEKFPDDTPKAIEEFKKATESDPKDTRAYWHMARLYDALKQYNEAEFCYRQIMKRDSKDLRAQWALAYLLVWDSQKYEEGLKEALIARERDTSSTSFVMEETIGKAYEGLRDIPNAIKHYKLYLKGFDSFDSNDYKNMKKKIAELEKTTQNSNSND